MRFELHSPFAPAGDQPRAIESLVKSVSAGRRQQVLMGVTGSGKTFTMANVIEQVHAHRRADAINFANAVRKAEQQRLFYGLRLESEPNNPHDANAIKVWGTAERKGWFGTVRRDEWHLGYVDAANASELKADLIARGIKIDVELYSVFVDDDYIDVKMIILAPPGHSQKVRMKARAGSASS
jgi:hypothetical protein